MANMYSGDRYLSVSEVDDLCAAIAARLPGWASWTQIGATREGRPIGLLTLGKQDAEAHLRPAIWLDGGTHASEWAGVMACAFAASAWADGLEADDPELVRWFERHTAFVVPCISPDGMSALMAGAPFLRSVLRRAPDGTPASGLTSQDVDGDGKVRQMRWFHASGPFVPDEQEPLLVRRRTLDDPPERACFVAPEGLFEDWDGHRWTAAPRAHPLDLNRNFPARWAPFRMFGMEGGPYPLSEPESRAVVEAVHARPGISAAITFHTYTGAILTQPYAAGSLLGDDDTHLMFQLASEMATGTGYRTIKVHPDFQYDPKQPIVGVWADTLATTFGVPGYTVEIWDPYGHAGAPVADPARFFVEADQEVLRAFARVHRGGDGAAPWRPFDHPQLGPVEIGGIDPAFTLYNPPVALLRAELEKTQRMCDRLRASLPSISATVATVPLGDGWSEVTLTLENGGYLPTSATFHAERAGLVPPIVARFEPDADATVRGAVAVPLGHLDGWGARQGLRGHPMYADLGARGHRAVARWLVRGGGTVRWQCARAGSGSVTVGAGTFARVLR